MTKMRTLFTLLATAAALPVMAQNVTVGGVDNQTGATLAPMTTDPVTTGYTPPAPNDADSAAGTAPTEGMADEAAPPTVSEMMDRAADASATTFVPFQSFQEAPQAPAAPMAGDISATMPSAMGMMSAPVASASPDVDFLRGMIAHHQNAIDMAKLVMKTGSDPYVKMLANDIVSEQSREIDWMKAWLDAHGPNPALAKDVGVPPSHGVSATLPPLPEKAKPAPKKKPVAKKKVEKKAAPVAKREEPKTETVAAPVADGKESAAKTVETVPAKEEPAAAVPAVSEDMGGAEEDATPPQMPNAFGR